MTEITQPLRVLLVDSVFGRGGAAAITSSLRLGLSLRGHTVAHAVGHCTDPAAPVLTMPRYSGPLAQALGYGSARLPGLLGHLTSRLASRLQCQKATSPGLENYNYPGSRDLLRLMSPRPDVVHCHNLHGDYFDLRYLPKLSARVPTLLTLHDAWLLGGHCAHSFGCDRWTTGCGSCPDLTIPPAIPVDRTAENWRRKRDIFSRSRLFITTPSRWMMEKVGRSILSMGLVDSHVIPNGVDLETYHPAEGRLAARRELGLGLDDFVVVFAANGVRDNVWKDMATLRRALDFASRALSGQVRVRFLALGESAPAERVGEATLEFVPYVSDSAQVARYFRAASVYAHAAKADTFPTTILEALACGTPIIATAVGGIPEQVRSLSLPAISVGTPSYPIDDATGILTAPGDADGLAAAMAYLARDVALVERLGHNARLDAERRFDVRRQVDTYVEWYRHMLERSSPTPKFA
ncbi:glycosyltransferase [Cyanobium sp. Cruz CV13-4-11]|nr:MULTISPECIES: glycosyltransferase [unclassified Cyanobium]MCP9901171.1 glycosyltransferase [Cyanobium sp. Cruz CV11-17]MCP9920209.1 glycosyltransferase [Cyanobium sp. Cruz CV13-4-11]